MNSVADPSATVDSSSGARFMAAFNAIEEHLRVSLSKTGPVTFMVMAREYADRQALTRGQREALAAFASLRNAISHGRYFEGRPIAEPVEQVVQQIEHLLAQLTCPPVALTVLGRMDVKCVDADDPIMVALEHVRAFDYSQLPVYRGGTYHGLLTTNTIARWLADGLSGGLRVAREASIAEVLRFGEPHEVAELRAKTLTAGEALQLLAEGGPGGQPLAALIITKRGEGDEEPLALAVSEDVSALSRALAL